MTQEEKAKRYDEALEELRGLLECIHEEKREILEEDITNIFSELKESEDEKIRNVLVDYFKRYKEQEECGIKTFYGIPTDNIIAWLEKQGEQKPQGKTALEAIIDEKVDNANKVEPKFKVGDWISGYYTNYKVLSVNNDGYLVEDVDGNKINILFENEKFHHLFTIADAKDGDVLHSTGLHNDCVFIFNGLDNWKFNEPNGDRAVATGYCCLSVSADKMEFGMQGPDCIEVDTVKPASKIQRDLLFQKMKEAGYEWDANHKQLKKIEQKPTWSEEDKNIMYNIISNLTELKDRYGEEYGKVGKCINWLKFLRPQYIWQPSDEQLEAFEHFVRSIGESDYSSPYENNTKLLYSLLEQLKKLK